MRRRPAKKSGTTRLPQQVRIISGKWRRTPLPVPDVDGLRPTPDRVRETVFNWLNHLIGGDWRSQTCLDLFAGSGALGFEAASRGASQVTLVESAPAALRQLDANKEKLRAEGVLVMRGDALAVAQRLAASGQRFSLIFLDPPYRSGLLPLTLSACVPLLTEGAIVYAETSEPLDRFGDGETPDWLSGWRIERADRAGAAFYYLLKRENSLNIAA